MPDERGVSGELVVTMEDVRDEEARVPLGSPPGRVTAVLRRANRRLLNKTIDLDPTVDGNEIVIPLPRAKCRVGDTISWQAYGV